MTRMKLALAVAAASLSGAANMVFAADARYVKPEISFEDGLETITENPARGLAGGGWVTFKPEGLPKWHGQGGFHSSLWELSRFSGGARRRADVRIPCAAIGWARSRLSNDPEFGASFLIQY